MQIADKYVMKTKQYENKPQTTTINTHEIQLSSQKCALGRCLDDIVLFTKTVYFENECDRRTKMERNSIFE